MNNIEESKDEYVDIDINGRNINNLQNRNKTEEANSITSTLDESISETFVLLFNKEKGFKKNFP